MDNARVALPDHPGRLPFLITRMRRPVMVTRTQQSPTGNQYFINYETIGLPYRDKQ